MLFSDITLIDENFAAQSHCWVGTRAERIAYIGTTAPREDYGEMYDGTGKVLMPGMYNAHAHAPMTLLRGYAEALPLQSWLNDKVFPFEAKIGDAETLPATRLAIAEMLRFGTVGFSDMYYHSDARAQAILESGIKCNMSEAALTFDDTPYADMPVSAINDHLVRTYHNTGDGRLKIELCVHAEYTSRPYLVQAIGDEAFERGLGTHIHLSETRSEHEECKQRHNGMTPAQYFDSLGFFRSPCIAAHCVWTEETDWEIMRDRGVTVASNPVSNLKLGSGIAPVPAMMEAGVRVALGTDGPASNNNHDLLQDMYVFALLHKGVSGDPTVLPPAEVLRCATANGALAQQRPDCGVIRVGNRADLVVIDFDAPHLQPATDVVSNIVYAAHGSDVCLTMVDGAVLYRDGEWPTIDVERAQAETIAATQHIIAQL